MGGEIEGESAGSELEVWGVWGGGIETKCNRNSLQSMKVTLMRISSNEDTESQLTYSYSWVTLPCASTGFHLIKLLFKSIP